MDDSGAPACALADVEARARVGPRTGDKTAASDGEDVFTEMERAAQRLTQNIGYVGAGTVEYLYNAETLGRVGGRRSGPSRYLGPRRLFTDLNPSAAKGCGFVEFAVSSSTVSATSGNAPTSRSRPAAPAPTSQGVLREGRAVLRVRGVLLLF